MFTPSIENLNKIAIEAENPSNMYFTLTVAGSSVASSDSSPPTGPAFQFAFEVFQGLASVSQCFTSPNHHPTIEGIISNRYGCFGDVKQIPKKGTFANPCFLAHFMLDDLDHSPTLQILQAAGSSSAKRPASGRIGRSSSGGFAVLPKQGLISPLPGL